MAKVLGVGGIFFKSPDPKRLYAWYTKYLGMEFEDWGTAYYPKAMPDNAQTVWSVFPATTKYFDPSAKDFMFNLIVDNLEEALAQVQEGGAEVVGKIEKLEYGFFGWFVDPDGNKVELWEPIKGEK
ncbi:MAG TPA: VOC family protein [Anaerolineales bacterium]|nr:VOC family protein [Anaerolineales bacterium]